MPGYLIKDTTKEERKQIVEESLGNISANCDGCMARLADMYQDYIDGKKEIREINMVFYARYVHGDMDIEEKRSCQMLRTEIIRGMDQNEVKYDKLLKIKTTGRDDSRADHYCNPYEPTPYGELERLA